MSQLDQAASSLHCGIGDLKRDVDVLTERLDACVLTTGFDSRWPSCTPSLPVCGKEATCALEHAVTMDPGEPTELLLFSRLSRDELTSVLAFLTASQLARATAVCHDWAEASRQRQLWLAIMCDSNAIFGSCGQPVDMATLRGVIAAMLVNVDDPEIQEAGLRTICNFTSSDDPTDLQAAVEAGAPPAVVAGMRTHTGVAEVQLHGCGALQNICQGRDAEGRARKQALADAGALPAVVAAMRAHVSCISTQKYGLGLLTNICNGKDEAAAARSQAVAETALPTLVAAMRTHAGLADVQLRACAALYNMCHGDDAAGFARRQAAVDAGALPTVVDAVQAHADVVRVRSAGCRALRRICRANDAGRRAAAALAIGADQSWLE